MTTLINDLHAEWVRARAHRLTRWVWPLILLSQAAVAAFAVGAVFDDRHAGVPVSSQIASAAFIPGGATVATGVLLAVLVASVISHDESSGTAHQLRVVMSDGRLLRARVAGALALAALATVSALLVTGVAFLFLPAGLAGQTLSSPLLWRNALGTVLVHALWALLALACVSLIPRTAVAMGGVLAIMIGLPSLQLALQAAHVPTAVFAYFPDALMTAATVTGSGSTRMVAPLVASALLVVWGVLAALVSALAHPRLRRS